MPRVLGLDVSANRVAWAVCTGTKLMGCDVIARYDNSFRLFADAAVEMLGRVIEGHGPDATCIEINLHPHIMHKGRPAANMVRAYMRSRWIEGALLGRLFEDEPAEIVRAKGGHHIVPEGSVFAMQASGSEGAKEKRRTLVSLLYGLSRGKLSEDEVDALAIAHECAVALASGLRKESRA